MKPHTIYPIAPHLRTPGKLADPDPVATMVAQMASEITHLRKQLFEAEWLIKTMASDAQLQSLNEENKRISAENSALVAALRHSQAENVEKKACIDRLHTENQKLQEDNLCLVRLLSEHQANIDASIRKLTDEHRHREESLRKQLDEAIGIYNASLLLTLESSK